MSNVKRLYRTLETHLRTTPIHCALLALATLLAGEARASKTVFATEVFFSAGSHEVPEESLPRLARMLCLLDGRNLSVLIAVGHASPDEPQIEALSRVRAQAVLRTFEALGVPADKLYGEGKGDKQPVAHNTSPEGRAKNRRAQVELMYEYDGRVHDPTCPDVKR